ncbi:hypothetical protein T03_15930 [Trichinella britovi]|uniref:Uncharacterized protein n=1 Tax=Trichinella britovi TaxID=45882 RepID=A0A0V1C6W5_TRIBR|nr:hypothetical protein T03_15930 [Trichinella britovi]
MGTCRENRNVTLICEDRLNLAPIKDFTDFCLLVNDLRFYLSCFLRYGVQYTHTSVHYIKAADAE